MPMPPLLSLPDIASYREYFRTNFCVAPLSTFDSLSVSFYPEVFNHAFFRDSSPRSKDKAVFDHYRAERMEWIRHILQDHNVELYRRVMTSSTCHGHGSAVRRLALESAELYLVVIQIDPNDATCARFITAYLVDSVNALRNIRSNPVW